MFLPSLHVNLNSQREILIIATPPQHDQTKRNPPQPPWHWGRRASEGRPPDWRRGKGLSIRRPYAHVISTDAIFSATLIHTNTPLHPYIILNTPLFCTHLLNQPKLYILKALIEQIFGRVVPKGCSELDIAKRDI